MRLTKKTLGLTAALLIGTALPAAAQDICGAQGAGGQWIGGSAASSDLSTASAALDTVALVMANGRSVSYFNLSQNGSVRVEAQAQGAGDPLVEIYDAAGNFIYSDDDSGGDMAARAEVDLQAGQYCAVVRTFDGSGVSAMLRTGLTSHEPLTAGFTDGGGTSSTEACTFDSASASLAVAALPASGSFVQMSTPSIGFELTQPTALSITAENTSADPLIAIYNEAGQVVGENDDFDGLNSRVDFSTPLPAGKYCISLGAFSDASQPITVTASAYDPNAASMVLVNRGEASPPLDGSVALTAIGELSARHRADLQATGTAAWYSFDVSEAGVVLIEAIANGAGDPIIYLYDDFGRQLGSNDDNGTNLDSLLIQRVTPGSYVLGVRLVGDGTQALTRVLLERYVPAK